MNNLAIDPISQCAICCVPMSQEGYKTYLVLTKK